MDNETYLKVSYTVVTCGCLALGSAAYYWLRGPIQGIARALPQENWRRIFSRGFPLSTLLFVMSASLSVNYNGGCTPIPYNRIVQDRNYIIFRNLEQISESLNFIVIGLFLWSLIVLVSLFAIRRAKGKPAEK